MSPVVNDDGIMVEVATGKDITIKIKDTSVSDIAEMMVNNKVNRIPIVDKEDRPAGIITGADIVKSFAKNQ